MLNIYIFHLKLDYTFFLVNYPIYLLLKTSNVKNIQEIKESGDLFDLQNYPSNISSMK